MPAYRRGALRERRRRGAVGFRCAQASRPGQNSPEDAIALLNWLPSKSLSRAFVLFPDPWPKKRHRERRIFSPILLEKLGRLLHTGAELRFASDIADYAEAAQEHAKAHPAFELAQIFTSADRDAAPDWPVTRYEQKAAKEGRRPHSFRCGAVGEAAQTMSFTNSPATSA